MIEFRLKSLLIPLVFGLTITGCESEGGNGSVASSDTTLVPQEEVLGAELVPLDSDESGSLTLASILDAQNEEVKARYLARHPMETIEFFGIEPGMTVVEVFPGGGWYSRILSPYLGEQGRLIGAHYPDGVYHEFGMTPERLEFFLNRDREWPTAIAETATVSPGAQLQSAYLTEMSEELVGQVDAFFVARALHNLRRYEPKGQYFSKAVSEMYRMLKPGGVVGVVQHRAPESNADDWADGNAGYIKQSQVIEAMESVGFVLEEASEINANPKDQPTEDDVVWRLAPGYRGTEPDTPEREAIAAIGESDRMTLRFRKPE